MLHKKMHRPPLLCSASAWHNFSLLYSLSLSFHASYSVLAVYANHITLSKIIQRLNIGAGAPQYVFLSNICGKQTEVYRVLYILNS